MKTLLLSATVSLLALTGIFAQGPLIPAGPPAPMMKTLDQLEPRIDVRTLPGDGASQFIISAPGSYYLSANVVGTSGFNGIMVTANFVTLDLNGFSVLNFSSGSLNGITLLGPVKDLTIRNGTVRGWGQSGIAASDGLRGQFIAVRAVDNGSRGIYAGSDASITDCMAMNNSGVGIRTGGGCVIARCTASANGGSGISLAGDNNLIKDCAANSNSGGGISASANNTIQSCTANSNLFSGISTTTGSTISGCTSNANGFLGISTQGNCTISQCTAFANTNRGIATGDGSTVRECTANSNAYAGIETGYACTVSGCTVRGNTNGIKVSNASHVTGNTCDANNSPTEGYGIWANGDTCRLDGNSVTANRVGIQAGFTTNTLIIRNSFRANTVTYYTAGQNDTVGPVIVPGNPITSNNPWANFGY